MSEHWKQPEGGPHGVAIVREVYEARSVQIDNFFGRPLHKLNYYVVHDLVSYAVFTFKEETDATSLMRAFSGERFNPADKGNGSNWMKWYKGRTASRDAKRGPYDFR